MWHAAPEAPHGIMQDHQTFLAKSDAFPFGMSVRAGLLNLLAHTCVQTRNVCHTTLPNTGTFKHSKGDYSTAIMVLAGLSAFTCILTANFSEPSDQKMEKHVSSRKSHDVAV